MILKIYRTDKSLDNKIQLKLNASIWPSFQGLGLFDRTRIQSMKKSGFNQTCGEHGPKSLRLAIFSPGLYVLLQLRLLSCGSVIEHCKNRPTEPRVEKFSTAPSCSFQLLHMATGQCRGLKLQPKESQVPVAYCTTTPLPFSQTERRDINDKAQKAAWIRLDCPLP